MPAWSSVRCDWRFSLLSGPPTQHYQGANSHFEASTAAMKLEQRLSSFDNVEMTSDFFEGGFRGECAVRNRLEIGLVCG
jgi:hypothetical protein